LIVLIYQSINEKQRYALTQSDKWFNFTGLEREELRPNNIIDLKTLKYIFKSVKNVKMNVTKIYKNLCKR